MPRKKTTTKEAIEKAIKIHGDKFGYEKFIFTDWRIDSLIYCKQHKGYFKQKPRGHIHEKKGCNQCAQKEKGGFSVEEQRKKLELAFGDKLCFKKFIYNKQRGKSIVKCKKHNFEFSINSRSLWETQKHCPKCDEEKIIKQNKENEKRIIKEAKLIHNNKYDYSEFKYLGWHKKSKIKCPQHGIFPQTPNKHLHSLRGCPHCAKNVPLNKEILEQRGRKIFGDLYSYDYVDYKRAQDSVTFFCNVHKQKFKQRVASHLIGWKGCKDCRENIGWSKTDFIQHCIKYKKNTAFFYAVRIYNKQQSFIKLGITSNTVEERYRGLKYEIDYEYEILYRKKGNPKFIWEEEKKYKKLFYQYKYETNLRFGGFTECFEEKILNLPEFKKIFR